MPIRDSTEHVIQGPSKEHEHTKVEFCGIVIPKKTAKEFPKQDVQPTLESAFQTYANLHAGSTRQAERTPKNIITIEIRKAVLTAPGEKRTLGRPAFPDKCVRLLKERTHSLCTQTGKTHAPRRSQLLSGTAETIERQSRD